MTALQPMPMGAVLAAIDIAKHRHEVLIESPGRRRRRRLSVLNTRADHDRLVEALHGLDAPVAVGFEATGNYHPYIASVPCWPLNSGTKAPIAGSMV